MHERVERWNIEESYETRNDRLLPFFIDFLISWISEQNNSNEKKKKKKKN